MSTFEEMDHRLRPSDLDLFVSIDGWIDTENHSNASFAIEIAFEERG